MLPRPLEGIQALPGVGGRSTEDPPVAAPIPLVTHRRAFRASSTEGPSGRRRREVVAAYFLMAPAVVLVLGVLAYPLGWMLWTSLTDRAVTSPATHFIGLRNYLGFLGDPAFWR